MTPLPPVPDLHRIGGQAIVEVLDSLLSLPATEASRVAESAEAATEQGILATVTLKSDRVSGAVRLRIPEAFARKAAGIVLGADGAHLPTDAQINDFSGEFANMVAGRVAAELGRRGHPCSLGIPEVGRGDQHLREQGPAIEDGPGGTDWSCQGHPIRIEVWCHHHPT